MYGLGKSSQVNISAATLVTARSLSASGCAQLAATPRTALLFTHCANQRRLQSHSRLELSTCTQLHSGSGWMYIYISNFMHCNVDEFLFIYRYFTGSAYLEPR